MIKSASQSQLKYFCLTKETLLGKLRYYAFEFWFLLFSICSSQGHSKL